MSGDYTLALDWVDELKCDDKDSIWWILME